jgi:hypothetical protein
MSSSGRGSEAMAQYRLGASGCWTRCNASSQAILALARPTKFETRKSSCPRCRASAYCWPTISRLDGCLLPQWRPCNATIASGRFRASIGLRAEGRVSDAPRRESVDPSPDASAAMPRPVSGFERKSAARTLSPRPRAVRQDLRRATSTVEPRRTICSLSVPARRPPDTHREAGRDSDAARRIRRLSGNIPPRCRPACRTRPATAGTSKPDAARVAGGASSPSSDRLWI